MTTRNLTSRTAALLVTLLIAAASILVPTTATAAEKPATAGTLTWGLKESFRTYIATIAHGEITTRDGATRTDDGLFAFTLDTGSYDPETQHADAQYRGTVHFTGHGGILDLTIANPRIEVGPTGGTLSADVASNSMDGTRTDYGTVRFASLGATGDRAVTDSSLTWSGLSATLTDDGAAAFAGFYPAGQVLDPAAVTLTGDWAAETETPDDFTEPGVTSFVASGTLAAIPGVTEVRSDPDRDLLYALSGAYWRDGQTVPAALHVLRLSTSEKLAEVPGILSLSAIVPATGEVVARVGTEYRIIRQNPAGGFELAEPLATAGTSAALGASVAVDRATSTIYLVNTRDNGTASAGILAYENTGAGYGLVETIAGGAHFTNTFVALAVDPLTGLLYAFDATTGTLATIDGRPDAAPRTLVDEPQQIADPGPFAYASTVDADTGRVFFFAGADNSVIALKDGALIGRTPTPQPHVLSTSLTIDPATGRVFALSAASSRLTILDGRGDLAVVDTVEFGTDAGAANSVTTDAAGRALVVVTRGLPTNSGNAASRPLVDTLRVIERATTPAVTTHPAAHTVSVTAGGTATATFTAQATGSPAPTVQWQTRTATGWVNLADDEVTTGATSETLTIAASIALNATQYRAVFTNTLGDTRVGAIASADATLAVTEKAATPPRATPAPTAVVPGSLTWGVKESFRSYITGNIAQGAIAVSGGASTQGGAFWFGQRATTWTAAAPAGTTDYAGAVRFTGHHGILDLTFSNPTVRLDSAARGALLVTVNGQRVEIGALALGAGQRQDAAGGVTYHNVPVTLTDAGARVFSYGSSQFYGAGTVMDPVTFTIGAAATAAPAAKTVAAHNDDDWTPPATPPATSGLSIDVADEIRPGDQLVATGTGFAPGETGIKVVLYSDPVVLEADLTADATGVARWTGILPVDVPPGEHTLTFQGSVNLGAPLTVASPAAPTGCLVENASLTWGFKESFRSYISGNIAHGEWTTDAGATYSTPTFAWTATEGALDTGAMTGQVPFAGLVRFTGHDGLLDTTIANPTLMLSGPDTAFLLLDVSGLTMEDALAGNTDAVETHTQVPFVQLDLAAGDVTVTDDGTEITAENVPTALTTQGHEAFPNYESGDAFDTISFTVTTAAGCGAPVAADEQAQAPDAAASLPVAEVEAEGFPMWMIVTGGVLLAALVIGGILLIVTRRRHVAGDAAGGAA